MVKILDTTLREGEQTPGVYFDVHIKSAIASLLDRLGVDIIETGHPAVTTEIRQAVNNISKQGHRALTGAHARSLQSDVDLALECGADFLGIFYCVSDERLSHHNRNLEEALDQITSVIKYARRMKPDLIIRYTPEDTVRSSFINVLKAARSAAQAGADIISVADTTGYMIPGTKNNMCDFVGKLKSGLAESHLNPMIAVHCHNDRGLALANALDAIRGGADIVDASVLGLGERAGIVDLGSLLAVLSNDINIENKWDMRVLPELYSLVSHYSGIPVPVNMPVTGKNAFTHCAGVHTQAALKNPLHYESLSPEIVGRTSEISLDHMSGLSAVLFSLEKIGLTEVSKEFAEQILAVIKETGMKGRTVDLKELKYIVTFMKQTVS